jgi:outer membrane protein OmpA-like peptidoglycan-associated protein
VKVTPIEERQLNAPRAMQSEPYNLPIITWGGDVATILANGSQAITSPQSIMAEHDLTFKLVREDTFQNQLNNYLSGKSPFLRGSMAMINMAASAVKEHGDLTPVVFYQLTWSSGGDALVVKDNIKRASDLCGKTIAINIDGPHQNYAYRILSDAGCDIDNVQFVWTEDLTGTEESPLEALKMHSVDAAFMIIPDALAATSGGVVGDGSEDSVKGAHILLSTKTANRVIADVYAVRLDFYARNKAKIEKLAVSLAKAQDRMTELSTKPNVMHELLSASSLLLLDTPDATADVEGLLLDATAVGMTGNAEFFIEQNNYRNFEQLVKESALGLEALGVVKQRGTVLKADFAYDLLANGSAIQSKQSTFDSQAVAKVVEQKNKLGLLDDSTVFEFEIYFKPNQKAFNESLYEAQFSRVNQLAQVYTGAVITVEGHSDPMGYLRKKKAGESHLVLNQIKQSAKNLSMTRAAQVRNAIVEYGDSHNTTLDKNQFTVIGHGIANPRTGVCGSDPCAPRTEQEWLSNMRVVFRILQVEAEESAFSPL